MIDIKTFYFNELRVCCYVVWDQTKECVIIDPGCYSKNEQERLKKFIEEKDLKPVKLLLTHGHFDHVMGNAFVSRTWNIKTYVHPNDIDQIKNASQYCAMFGYNIEEPPLDTVDLKEGDDVTFGVSILHIIHTPGHTQGGVCFYNEGIKVLFTGDTLFAGSIGRTDHPGGNYEQLLDSIFKKITILPSDTVVLPGHGPASEIGIEVKSNPFLQPY